MSMKLTEIFRRKATIDDLTGREQRKAGKKDKVGGFMALSFGGIRSFVAKKSMRLPAVYRCVELISNSVAQLPLEPYQINEKGHGTKMREHPTYHLLNCEPNARMTRFVFIKTLVTSMLLDGNGYAYIERDGKGMPIRLHYIPSEFVTPEQPKTIAEPITYILTGVRGSIPAANMIHLLNFSYDGLVGVSTISHAADTLGLAANAEKHASGFFAGGCNIGGILSSLRPMTDQQKADLKAAWKEAHDPGEGGESNGLVVLTQEMKYQPISVNPRDSMLLESRRFSVEDICRFFGVDPTKCGDLSKSSYNTLEQTTQAFLNDTLTPILVKIEQEFERKLYPTDQHDGVAVKFDTAQLLRGDKAAQASFYSSLFAIGVYSPNEIRQEQGLPPVDGGDHTFVQVNVQTLQTATKPKDEAPEIPKKNENAEKEPTASL